MLLVGPLRVLSQGTTASQEQVLVRPSCCAVCPCLGVYLAPQTGNTWPSLSERRNKKKILLIFCPSNPIRPSSQPGFQRTKLVTPSFALPLSLTLTHTQTHTLPLLLSLPLSPSISLSFSPTLLLHPLFCLSLSQHSPS